MHLGFMPTLCACCGVYTYNIFPPNIYGVGKTHVYMEYTRDIRQGAHQVYGHIRCVCGIFGREITKYTVIYGVYVVLINLPAKSSSIRSCTVCVYTVLANPTNVQSYTASV
jgi:hypothetical protein